MKDPEGFWKFCLTGSEENSPIISCPKSRIFILSLLLHVQVFKCGFQFGQDSKCPAQKASGQEPACQESRVR